MKKPRKTRKHHQVFNITKMETKYEHGYTYEEIQELLIQNPNINVDKFNEALIGCTGQMIDEEFITYAWDVEKALQCGTENRDLTIEEWD